MAFKKTNTKILLISHAGAAIFIILMASEAIEVWENNPDRSFHLIALIGFVLEILGFIIMLNPKFVRLIVNREIDFTYEAILYVLAGLVIQAIVAYYFL